MYPKLMDRHTRIIACIQRHDRDVGYDGMQVREDSGNKTWTEAYRLPSENRKMQLIRVRDPRLRSVRFSALGRMKGGGCVITTASIRGAHILSRSSQPWPASHRPAKNEEDEGRAGGEECGMNG